MGGSIQNDLNLKEFEDKARPAWDVGLSLATQGASTQVTEGRRQKRAQKSYKAEQEAVQKTRADDLARSRKKRSKMVREGYAGSLMGDRSLQSPDMGLSKKLGGGS